jgi:hypothetical protein
MITPHSRMKTNCPFRVCLIASLALAYFAFSAQAEGMNTKPGAASSETNLVPVERSVPLSVFDTTEPYKDPFFPNSTRKRVQTAVTNVVINTGDPTQYALKGLSGADGQRLAIINNRNAAEGERVDVTLPNGATVWITVTKIEPHSAIIIPDGQQPITISLPKEDW